MNNLFRTFNVTSQKEFDKLVEGMDLDENQLVQLFDIVSRDEDVLVARKELLECSAMFGNGTYELLLKQFKKQPFKRTLKENEQLAINEPMPAEEEVKEEGPKADSELSKVISSMTGVIEKTSNAEILDGIVKTIDSKLAVADNLDQKEELMTLKDKALSKMNMSMVSEAVVPTNFEETDSLDDMFKKLERPITYNITINYNKEKDEEEKEEKVEQESLEESVGDNYLYKSLSEFVQKMKGNFENESTHIEDKVANAWSIANDYRDFEEVRPLCENIEKIITMKTISETTAYTVYNSDFRGNVNDLTLDNLVVGHCTDRELTAFLITIKSILNNDNTPVGNDSTMWDGSEEGNEQTVETTQGSELKRQMVNTCNEILGELSEAHTVDMSSDYVDQIHELYINCLDYSSETDIAANEFIDNIRELARDTGQYDESDITNIDLVSTMESIDSEGFDNIASDYATDDEYNEVKKISLECCKNIEKTLMKKSNANTPININDDEYELDESANSNTSLLSQDGAEDFIKGAHAIIEKNKETTSWNNEIVALIWNHEIDYPKSKLKDSIIENIESEALSDAINYGDYCVYDTTSEYDSDATYEQIYELSTSTLIRKYASSYDARELASKILQILNLNNRRTWTGSEDENEVQESEEDENILKMADMCEEILSYGNTPISNVEAKIEKICDQASYIRELQETIDDFIQTLRESAMDDETYMVYRDVQSEEINYDATKDKALDDGYSYLIKNYLEERTAAKIIDEIEDYYDELVKKQSSEDEYELDESANSNSDISFMKKAAELFKNVNMENINEKTKLLSEIYSLADRELPSLVAQQWISDIENQCYYDTIEETNEFTVYETINTVDVDATEDVIDSLDLDTLINDYSSSYENKNFAKSILEELGPNINQPTTSEWSGEEDDISVEHSKNSDGIHNELINACNDVISNPGNVNLVNRLASIATTDSNSSIKSIADDFIVSLESNARTDENLIVYTEEDDYDNINEDDTRENMANFGFEDLIENYLHIENISNILESITKELKENGLMLGNEVERPIEDPDDYELDESRNLTETDNLEVKRNRIFSKEVARELFDLATHMVKVERMGRIAERINGMDLDEATPLMRLYVEKFQSILVRVLYKYNPDAPCLVKNEGEDDINEEASVENLKGYSYEDYIEQFMYARNWKATDMMRDVLREIVKWFEDHDIDLYELNSYEEHHSDEIDYDLEESAHQTNNVLNLKEGDVITLNGKRMTIDTIYDRVGYRLVYDNKGDEDMVREKYVSKEIVPYKMVSYKELKNAFNNGSATIESNDIDNDYVIESFNPQSIDDIVEGTIWVNKKSRSWEATVYEVDKFNNKVKITWEEANSNGYMTFDLKDFLDHWEPIEKHEKPISKDVYELDESYNVGDILHSNNTDLEYKIISVKNTKFGKSYELESQEEEPFSFSALEDQLSKNYKTDDEYNHKEAKKNSIWKEDDYDEDLDESVEEYPIVDLYNRVKNEIGNLKSKIMDKKINDLVNEWCQTIYGPISSYNDIVEKLILVSKYYRDAASKTEENYEKRIERVIKSFTDDFDPEDDSYLIETPSDLEQHRQASAQIITKGNNDVFNQMVDILYGYDPDNMSSEEYTELFKRIYEDYKKIVVNNDNPNQNNLKMSIKSIICNDVIDYINETDYVDDFVVQDTDYDEEASQESFSNVSLDDILRYLDDSEMDTYVHNWLLQYGVDTYNRGQNSNEYWSGEEDEQGNPQNNIQHRTEDPVVEILEDFYRKHHELNVQWMNATENKYIYADRMADLSTELIKKLKMMGYNHLIGGLIEDLEEKAFDSGDFNIFNPTGEIDYISSFDRLVDDDFKHLFNGIMNESEAEVFIFNPLRSTLKDYGYEQTSKISDNGDDEYSLDESLMETRGNTKSLLKHSAEEIANAPTLNQALDLFCDDYETALEYGSNQLKLLLWSKCYNTVNAYNLDINVSGNTFSSDQFKEIILKSKELRGISDDRIKNVVLKGLHNDIKNDLEKIIFAVHDDEYTEEDKEEDYNDYDIDS